MPRFSQQSRSYQALWPPLPKLLPCCQLPHACSHTNPDWATYIFIGQHISLSEDFLPLRINCTLYIQHQCSTWQTELTSCVRQPRNQDSTDLRGHGKLRAAGCLGRERKIKHFCDILVYFGCERLREKLPLSTSWQNLFYKCRPQQPFRCLNRNICWTFHRNKPCRGNTLQANVKISHGLDF